MKSRPRAYSAEHHSLLVKGAKVIILETENTLHRLPQYIGQIGTIKEAPVHPTTWFKVRFDDGHVCTFRPSALLHAEEGADGSYIIAPPPQPKSRPKEPAVSSAHSLSNKHNTTPSSEGVLIPGNGMILCDLQTDLWIGAKVRILSGKYNGQDGAVLRSGNGWVQVEMNAPHGEIAKRVNDLEVVEYFSVPYVNPADLVNTVITPEKVVNKRRADATAEEPAKKQLKIRACSDEYQSAEVFNGNQGTKDANKVPLLIHPDIKEARYQYVQKYVKRVTEKIRNRPDLKYWSHVLRANHVMSGGEPDPLLERQIARDFVDDVCCSCLTERWPFAKHCWNEACPQSPVYWKLTGKSPKCISSLEDRSSLISSSGNRTAFEIVKSISSATTMDNHENKLEKTPDIAYANMKQETEISPEVKQISSYDKQIKIMRRVSPPLESNILDLIVNEPTVLLQSKRHLSEGLSINIPQPVPINRLGKRIFMGKFSVEEDRVCGDNWSVPVEYCDEIRDVSISDGDRAVGFEFVTEKTFKQIAPLQVPQAHRVTLGSLDDVSNNGVRVPHPSSQVSPVLGLLNNAQSPAAIQLSNGNHVGSSIASPGGTASLSFFPQGGSRILLSSISASGIGCAGPVSPYLARGPEGLGTFPAESFSRLQRSPSKY